MKLTIIGTGYVGLVTGACFANFGNDIICLDIDKEKISKLNQGIIPIYEPGLNELVKTNSANGRLKFTTDKKQAISHGEIILIAVGTPSNPDGSVYLGFVDSAAKDIAGFIDSHKTIVNKSTVPIGTAERVKKIIRAEQQKLGKNISFDVVSNPEFLREGSAVNDFQHPDRIIIGAESEKTKEIMTLLYQPIERTGKPVVFTDIKSAEMIKYASNAMLATRISFVNEIAGLCEKTGADIKQVAKGIGLDTRIGPRFLQAGAGYGGSCFPKDVKGLIDIGKQNNVDMKLLKAVDEVNEAQKKSLFPKIKNLIGGTARNIAGKKIAVWGLAFKPKTDDMREAPSMVLIEQLLKEGAVVNAFDPIAQENTTRIIEEKLGKEYYSKLNFSSTPYDAAENADCIVLVTEWDEFRQLDFDRLKQLMKSPNIIDGRNVYEPEFVKSKGFNYNGIGRN